MKKLKILAFIAIFLSGIAVYSWQLPDYKSRILLSDTAQSVEDSMRVMLSLCKQLGREDVTNCFVTPGADSTLIINNSRFGDIRNADVSVLKLSGHLHKMTDTDVSHLLSVFKFLNRNLISGVYYNNTTARWVFNYGVDSKHNEFFDQRELLLIDKAKAKSDSLFLKYYNVVDHRGNLVLVSLKDVRD